MEDEPNASATSLEIRQHNGGIIGDILHRCGVPITAKHLTNHVAAECEASENDVQPIVSQYLRLGTDTGFVKRTGRKYAPISGVPAAAVDELAKTTSLASRSRQKNKTQETSNEAAQKAPKRTKRSRSRSRKTSRSRSKRSTSGSRSKSSGNRSRSPMKRNRGGLHSQ